MAIKGLSAQFTIKCQFCGKETHIFYDPSESQDPSCVEYDIVDSDAFWQWVNSGMTDAHDSTYYYFCEDTCRKAWCLREGVSSWWDDPDRVALA